MRLQKVHVEEYLKGTMPEIKWLFFRFLTFVFGVPICFVS